MVFSSKMLAMLGGAAVGAAAVGAGPQLVQANFMQGDQLAVANNPGNIFKFQLPEALGAGNCLVLVEVYRDTADFPTITLSSISDSVNGSWSTSPLQTANGGSSTTRIYLFPNTTGGAVPTFTVTYSGNVFGPRFTIMEWSGIATSTPANGGSVAADQTWGGGATPVQCGSFTPTTNNNANGGNLILSFFGCSTGATAGGNVTTFTPSAGFTLLSADIGWFSGTDGLSAASAYQVQSTQAAVNPGMTPTGNTTDSFNCVTIALKASPGAGTPPPNIMRVASYSFFFATQEPASWVIQVPTVGNQVVLGLPNVLTSVTDSDSNTYTGAPGNGGGFGEIWYSPLRSANPSLKITLHGTAGAQQIHVSVWDLVGASGSIGASGTATVATTASSSPAHAPDITPTKTGSIVILEAPDGLGPVNAITAPSNGVSDIVLFNNNSDGDSYSSGDGHAHFRVTSGMVGVSQNVTWLMGASAGTSDISPQAVEFKAP